MASLRHSILQCLNLYYCHWDFVLLPQMLQTLFAIHQLSLTPTSIIPLWIILILWKTIRPGSFMATLTGEYLNWTSLHFCYEFQLLFVMNILTDIRVHLQCLHPTSKLVIQVSQNVHPIFINFSNNVLCGNCLNLGWKSYESWVKTLINIPYSN